MTKNANFLLFLYLFICLQVRMYDQISTVTYVTSCN